MKGEWKGEITTITEHIMNIMNDILAKYRLSKSMHKGENCVMWRRLYHVLEAGKNKTWVKREKSILFEWGNNKNAKFSIINKFYTMPIRI